MAKLVMAAVTPHNPLLWRAMRDPMPDDLAAVRKNFSTIRDTIRELEVDVAVVVGTDHIRQFFFDNSPAFIIGKAESYHGTYENEVRTFGMDYAELQGHRELSDEISGRTVLPENIDFAVSYEWRLDHGFVIPLQYVIPDLDIPIVPIHVNAALPPMPSPRRFAALGDHLRDTIERWDSDARVALLTSGHMATDVGGPKQFAGSPDPVFDAEAVGWMRDGDLEAAIHGCRFDRIMAAGNITYQYVNAITALAAMNSAPADLAEATESRFASSPFFMWRAA
ncbi:Protocatechuate 4,5-dioxygenase beta chain [marine actinobacterium PHSC20C1]|nr:Protocatechuate 4,5-dioxygenase beta chain [marine actinobacterium PHSC20C1]